MSSQSLLFSIIIPVYKVRENYLRKCIESTLRQRCSSYEVIIVDDGSPDNSGQICDEYEKNNNVVMVIHKENEGVSCARNDGVQKSSAQWILFLDADDWLEDNTLETLEEVIQQYHDCDVIQFRTFQNYQNNEKRMDLSVEVDRCYEQKNKEDQLFLLRQSIQPSRYRKGSITKATGYFVWDKAYKREFLVKNDIRFEKGIKVSEDKLFYLRCLEKFSKIVAINMFFYHYRANEDSVTHKYSSDLDINRLTMLKELMRIIERIVAKDIEIEKYLLQDYEDFCVVMASNVIINQYYHTDSPLSSWEKWKASFRYLRQEPFLTALRDSKINGLTNANKIRLILLKLKAFFLLGPLSNINRIMDGRSLSVSSEESL